jgi:hypothetical protein
MTRDEAVKLLLEELIDKLAVQLGISGAESRETRWADERWQRGVLGAALAALTDPAAGEDVEALLADLRAVDTRYRGDPAHDLDGYTVKTKMLEIVERHAARLRAVPQGWKLVPIEPTPEMLEAYVDACFRRGQAGVEGIKVGWPAACAAAPAPEKEQPK